MKFVSWNVNGLRAVIKKDFFKILDEQDADFFCIQETKMQKEDVTFFDGIEDGVDKYKNYYVYMNSALRKGYSGTMIFSKYKANNVIYEINHKHNDEGRCTCLEFDDFYLVCLYSPNSKEELARIDYRCEYEDDLRIFLNELKAKKHVIMCGDLNVAHNEIDLKNPQINHFNPGFSDQERGKFTELLNSGFIDTFRYLYPDTIKYSWWSYRAFGREKNVGWRIDYFIISPSLVTKLKDATIENGIYGSDHCPVTVTLDL